MIRWITFIYAGFWGGVSGLLYVYYNKYIHPTSLSTTSSAEALLGVIAGGSGTLGGPVVGAALVLLLKNYASAYVEQWNMLLGFVFLFIVLVMPTGIVPGVERLARTRGIAMAPMTSDYALEVIGLNKASAALPSAGRIARDQAGRTPPAHRSERRRQDHAVQPDQRRYAAECGRDQAVRHRHHAFGALPARPSRAGANLPDHHVVLQRHTRTQRRARPARYPAVALADWRPLTTYGDLATEARRILDTVGLLHLADHPVSDVAYGEQRRVELAVALAQRPRILLLDEPLAGLSGTERPHVKLLIASSRGKPR